MNKRTKKILRLSILTSFLALIVLYATVYLTGYYKLYIKHDEDPNVKYDVYGEKYTYFGDGRFQVEDWMDGLGLTDYKYDSGGPSTIVSKIDRYFFADQQVFVSGDFQTGTATNANGIKSYMGGIDTSNGEIFYYDSIESIPRFLILNITSGSTTFYKSIDEIPTDQRKYFEMDLTGNECIKEKTCYDSSIGLYKASFSTWEILQSAFR